MGNSYEVGKAPTPGKGAADAPLADVPGKLTRVELELRYGDAPARLGPGVAVAQKQLAAVDPSARDLARVLDQYPEERVAIVEAIRRAGGEPLVQGVLEAERALRKEQALPHFDLGQGGFVLGDTVVGPPIPIGPNERYSNAQNKAAEQQRIDNQRAADARGEKNPNPIVDAIRGKKPLTADERKAQDKADDVIDSARRQLARPRPDGGTPEQP